MIIEQFNSMIKPYEEVTINRAVVTQLLLNINNSSPCLL